MRARSASPISELAKQRSMPYSATASSVTFSPARHARSRSASPSLAYALPIPARSSTNAASRFIFPAALQLFEPCHGRHVERREIAVLVVVVACHGNHCGVVGRELEFRQERAPAALEALLDDAVAQSRVGLFVGMIRYMNPPGFIRLNT